MGSQHLVELLRDSNRSIPNLKDWDGVRFDAAGK